MITRIHANLEENHEYDFLLLSTITEQQQKTRLEAIEKWESLQKNLELRLNKLKLRRTLDLEIKHSKRSPGREMKDYIKRTSGCVQENKENEYMSDHLFTMHFRTEDNSLQDCSSEMQYLNIQDIAGENIVRIEYTTLKEFNKETTV